MDMTFWIEGRLSWMLVPPLFIFFPRRDEYTLLD